MEIFDFINYKEFTRSKVAFYPKKGHGIYRKLGLHIGLNSVAISQVFKGQRELTLEQALGVCEFFNLTPLEQEYYLLMVQYERAGNHKLKKVFLNKLNEIQTKSQNLKNRLIHSQEVTLEAKSIYYSHWVYSGVRITSSLEDGQTIEQLAEKLDLPLSDLVEIMEFLIENGLCKRVDNKYTTGVGMTHLDALSPLAVSHHHNWRIKAMEKMTVKDQEQVFYTIPVSISKTDLKNVRKKIVGFIEEINKIVQPSPAETVACLNIDWFKFGKSTK